jgi:hypothetical protein
VVHDATEQTEGHACTAPTLVATGGGVDPDTAGLARGFFDDAADAVAVALPHAERRVVDSDTHVADPLALGEVPGHGPQLRHRRRPPAEGDPRRLRIISHIVGT